jgi:hypothetical protein
MRTVFFVVLYFSAIALTAQTNLIALRSHSGNLAFFKTEPDNLGLVQEFSFVVDTVVIISDTSAVEFYAYGGENNIPDTVFYAPYLDTSMTAESRELYYPGVVFINQQPKQEKVWVEDTLAKPKEQLQGRHDVIKNEMTPAAPGNDNGPLSPGSFGIIHYFVLGLIAVMLTLGVLIWYTNRKTITA